MSQNRFGQKSGNKSGARHSTPAPARSTGRPAPRSTPRPSDQFKISKTQRWVVGNHAIMEVLNVRPKEVVKAIFQQGWQSVHFQKEIHQKAKSVGVAVEEKTKGFLDQIYSNHQGCVLIVEGRPEFSESELSMPSQILFLDGIEDPHNLGAICRTAWLLGVDGIFIPQDRAVDITPTVHKVACGGVEHVPVILETQFKNPIERFKEMGYWVYGLSHKATKNVFECQFPKQIVWCIGAEDKGLRTATEKLCDDLVSIPQISAPASYNASVAAAMALSEGYRQQHYPVK